ncbi:ABC transporter ATP-binding protein [Corynebacterium choanae]|uniref:ATP-binding cassette domain-containing protein n=1 Tax=Corynebacterium choanae TaxID=1862358 RepID=UPI0013DD96D8|nr:ABC transporter ATP-binding protein [Corynebacterium choanae]
MSGQLNPADVELFTADHLLITGGNDAGKTTLVEWIAASVPPSTDAHGAMTAPGTVGFCLQSLHNRNSPVTDTVLGDTGKGWIYPRLFQQPLRGLSDGNRRRMMLAAASANNPTIVIIDAPTNYLMWRPISNWRSHCAFGQHSLS